ncbi:MULTISPECIES: hypothetical protein [Streptomyces]|uniref:Integral membrane protein n=1 Tax=Streptomyces griseus subsp. griseus (strain JCM 4626 / CBS 651.72 / NBRC 13350 / KCC S-0626 / ISP 5235) TaxID=455632 RepID=B1VXC1_STRGG|nr:hypothetical protein [Streptomyces griseus]BAG21767.1 putative integral membrane protein [Streptomyces griseus subsp. griseus NBRC 13350]SEE62402.1 hypothetical protein SAMN04490359_4546 [Streptomyces griseus]SQA21649.1 integral membrane protein [Streptomyces griseus]
MDYGKHQAPRGYEPGESVPATLIRIPVRIVVVVLVLPVRMAWDVLTALGHAADRALLRPLGRALARLLDTLVLTPLAWLYTGVLTPLGKAAVRPAAALLLWPWVGLWRYVVVPVARHGIAAPAVWLYAHVLTPLGHGLRWIGTALPAPAARALGTGLDRLLDVLLLRPVAALWRHVIVPAVRHGLVAPAVWLHETLLTPLGQGTARVLGRLGRAIAATGRGLGTAAAWLVMTLLVAPASWTYRRILAPVGREVAAAFEVAWRITGYVSRAVGRFVARLAWHLIGAPVSWAYRTLCVPVGHFLRDSVWAPARRASAEAGRAARAALASARETVRRARRDAWRALGGSTDGARSREPVGIPARTLGSTTTVPSAAQATESAPFGEKFVERV